MAAASVEFGGILPFDCTGAITSVAPAEKVEKNVRILYLSKRNHQQCSEKRFAVTLRRHRSARIVRNPARSRAAGRYRR